MIIWLILSLVSMIFAAPRIDTSTYMNQRQLAIANDEEPMLGNNLNLSAAEELVNSYIMDLKNSDMTNGFQTLDFHPSESFFVSKEKIDQSEIFSVIKNMPKGAILHIHDTGIASTSWIVSELTYWPDLYMCDTGPFLQFRFFDTPDVSCSWEVVADARAAYSSPEDFDAYLISQLSIQTNSSDTYSDINDVWVHFQNSFASLEGLLCYIDAWRMYMERSFYEAMMDNILYIEFRGVLPLLYEKDGTTYNEFQTLQIYKDVIANFTSTYANDFFGAKLIYAPLKTSDTNKMWNFTQLAMQLREAFPETVIGFDLVGQEDTNSPLINYIDSLLNLINEDPQMKVFYHAGETNWYGLQSDENLFDALLLNSTRIGHGYAIAKHPSLVQMALDKNIALEICPISNQVLMLVDDLRNHPITSLAADNFPIVISSDDPALWNALPLSHDFYEAFYAFGGAKADLKFLKQLALNSIEYSGLTAADKQSLQSMWQMKWDDFIQNTLSKIDTKNSIN